MYAALIRKDYVLIKSQLLSGLAQFLFILIMLTVNLRKDDMGAFGYLVAQTGMAWWFIYNLTDLEKKYGGMNLLLSTPYTLSRLIIGRYLSAMLIFPAAAAVYLLIATLLRFTGVFPMPDFHSLALAFMLTGLSVAITLPLYLKIPYQKAQIIVAVLFLGIPLSWLIMVSKFHIVLEIKVDNAWKPYIYLGIGLISLLISMTVTLVSCRKKEGERWMPG